MIARIVVAIVLSALMGTVPVMAQEASFSGRVTDVTGSVVPGALVVATNTDTGVRSETLTNVEGLFVVPSVQPGLYSVVVSLVGFASTKLDQIRVDVGDRRDLSFELKPGVLQETITVIGGTVTPMMTTRAERGVVVEQEFVKSIPLNVRNPLLMINNVVGVTPGLATSGSNTASQTATNTFRINGTKAGTSDVQLDGSANLTAYVNQVASIPQVDAVEQFRVVTSAYAPENGRTSSGVVNYSLRSGTSQYRGTVHEFFRDARFDAAGFNLNKAGQKKLDLSRHQYGFTFGGPLKLPRERSFFFLGGESLREQRAGSFTGTVPTALERIGDFSQSRDINGNLILIYDPRTTRLDPARPAGTTRYIRDPFPGNRIPSELINPTSLKLLQYYPQPNQAGQGLSNTSNFFSAAPAALDTDRIDLRVDEGVSSDQRLTFRYNYFLNRNKPSDPYENGYGPIQGTQRLPGVSVMLRHSWTGSSSFLFEHHLSYAASQSNRTSEVYGVDPVSELGFAPSMMAGNDYPTFPVVTATRVSGVGTNSGQYERNSSSVWQYLATGTWLRGRHVVKAGFDARRYPVTLFVAEPIRISATRNFTGGPNPQAANALSGHGVADLLLGATGVSNGIIEPDEINHPYFGVFLQDELRLTPDLTLTYGLRYSVEPTWDEKNDHFAFLDLESPSPIASQVPSIPDLRGGLGFAGQNGAGSRPQTTDWNNWDPRAGMAWSVNEQTVVHGGFGVFHHAAPGFVGDSITVGASRVSTAIVTQPDTVTPLFNMTDAFPAGLQQPPGTSAGLTALLGQNVQAAAPDQKVSYQINWSADVQRQLPANLVVTVGYAASLGRNLLQRINRNQLPDEHLALGSRLLEVVENPFFGVITDPTSPLSQRTVQRGQLLRPYPHYLDLLEIQSPTGKSRYHALQLTAERRFSSGLGTVFAYTFSRSMDNVSESISALAGGRVFQNNNCPECDWSTSLQDIAHVFRWSVRYDLPFGPGHARLSSGALSQVLGGWGLAAFAAWDTGTPLRLTSPNDTNSFGGGAIARPSIVERVSPVIDDRELTDGGLYFNPAAFVRTAPFRFGTAPRGLGDVRNPGGRNVDLLVEKRFSTGGRKALDIRIEFFNAFNWVQYTGPGLSVTGTDFGRIFFQQANTPRQIQFGARFSF